VSFLQQDANAPSSLGESQNQLIELKAFIDQKEIQLKVGAKKPAQRA
jgi:hypothetical protein